MRSDPRLIIDRLAGRTMLVVAVGTIALSLVIGAGLYFRSAPLFETTSIARVLTSHTWSPAEGEFGLFPFIVGTLAVTAIAVGLMLPLCLLSAIYIAEYAHRRVRGFVVSLFGLLSAIPPVVFGVWGVLAIVPAIRDHVAPAFGATTTGYSVLAGGIVLAIMIAPLLLSILLELFGSFPREVRDASLSLGATRWQTVKRVLLRQTFPGIIAATVLAISRALGETIAVMMVCGNVPEVPRSLFDPVYPLPALIANNYGEMMSIPSYDAALIFAAFILFTIIFISSALARAVLRAVERRIGG